MPDASSNTTNQTGIQSQIKKKYITKNVVQTKEWGENLQDQINEEEIGNLLKKNSE